MYATDAMASACDGADEVEGAAANSSVDAVDATGADDVGGGTSLVSKDRRVKFIVR